MTIWRCCNTNYDRDGRCGWLVIIDYNKVAALFTFYGQIHHYTGHWRSRTGRSNKTENFQWIFWLYLFFFCKPVAAGWVESLCRSSSWWSRRCPWWSRWTRRAPRRWTDRWRSRGRHGCKNYMRRIIDKFWLVVKFETCRPRLAEPAPWGSSWTWQTCRRRWSGWGKCRQNTFLHFVIYLYSGYVIKIALHWPEEALAGAHQGGELEVVRAKDHLEGRSDLFYALPKSRFTHPAKAKPMYRREAQMRKRSMLGAAPCRSVATIRRMGHVGHLHCEDQDVVRLEEAEVSEKAKPNQKVPGAWFPSNFDKIQILRMLKDSHQAWDCRRPTCRRRWTWTRSAAWWSTRWWSTGRSCRSSRTWSKSRQGPHLTSKKQVGWGTRLVRKWKWTKPKL